MSQEDERKRPLEGSDICPEEVRQKEKHWRNWEEQVQRPWGRDKPACLKNKKASVPGGERVKEEWGEMRLETGEASSGRTCRP